MDLNRRPLVSEKTAPPTEPRPLPHLHLLLPPSFGLHNTLHQSLSLSLFLLLFTRPFSPLPLIHTDVLFFITQVPIFAHFLSYLPRKNSVSFFSFLLQVWAPLKFFTINSHTLFSPWNPHSFQARSKQTFSESITRTFSLTLFIRKSLPTCIYCIQPFSHILHTSESQCEMRRGERCNGFCVQFVVVVVVKQQQQHIGPK